MKRNYPFYDKSKAIQQLKCELRNAIYGVFQEIKQELVSPVYTEEPKLYLQFGNSYLLVEHICYMEIPNEIEPLVSIVFEGKEVRGLKSLTIEELESVYKLVYAFTIE